MSKGRVEKKSDGEDPYFGTDTWQQDTIKEHIERHRKNRMGGDGRKGSAGKGNVP